MLLGTAKVCITPPVGVWQGGYASRTRPCEKISEDIFLRVHVHRHQEQTVAYIYADIVQWDNLVVAELRNTLREKFGLKEDQLVFLASHNHSGPIVGHDEMQIPPAVESPAYTSFVMEQVCQAVKTALSGLREVTMVRYNGLCRQNVFRRVSEDGKVRMAPNYEVPADRNLTVLAMRDGDGVVRGLMVHYACHANLANNYELHPDYPGVALRMLDETYPDSVALFMQGCTGDLRPNSVCGTEFVPAQYNKVLQFAEIFANTCRRTMEGPAIPVKDGLRVAMEKLRLPLVNTRTRDELEELTRTGTDFQRFWAQTVLRRGNPASEVLEIMQIRYGSGCTIYALNGEVVQAYAAYARELDPEAVCAAYTNGMIGYISTAKEIVEGGYEPDESAPYFGLAGTYSIEIEQLIRDRLRKLRETIKN